MENGKVWSLKIGSFIVIIGIIRKISAVEPGSGRLPEQRFDDVDQGRFV